MRHSKSLASVRGARLGAALRVDILLRVARQRGDYADAMACEELTEPVHVGLHQHRKVAPVDDLDAQGRGALDERAESVFISGAPPVISSVETVGEAASTARTRFTVSSDIVSVRFGDDST